MRSFRRPGRAVSLAVVPAVLALGGCAEGDPLADYYAQELAWEQCADVMVPPSFDCAWLTVPVDYDRPGTDDLQIAVYRRTAENGSAARVVVMAPGGPGVSGVATLDYPSEVFVLEADLVSFDPRGAGRTAPARCREEDQVNSLLSVDRTPDTPAEVEAFAQERVSYAAACAEWGAELLPYLGTRETVRDLDVLRAALGLETLDLWGASYGALAASEYAQAFPTRVGRFALDSPFVATLAADPERELALRAERLEERLDDALALCADGRGCSLGGLGADAAQARASLEGWLADLDAVPVQFGARGLLTRERAVEIMEGALALDRGLFLVLALDSALAGDTGRLEILDVIRVTYASSDAVGVVTCADRGQRATEAGEAAQAARRWEAEHPVFGATLAWRAATDCTPWPVGPTLDAEPVTTDVPLLVVASAGDPFSPPEVAAAVAEQFPAASVVLHRGSQHVAYFSSACIADVTEAYLLRGERPSRTECG